MKVTVVEKLPARRAGAVLVRLAARGEAPRVPWGKAEFLPPQNRPGRPRNAAAEEFVSVIGLGDATETEKRREGLRRGVGRTVMEARRRGVQAMLLDVSGEEDGVALGQAALEAAYLADYAFVEYKKSLAREQRKKSLRALTLVVSRRQREAAQRAAKEAQIVMRSVTAVRDLVNQPASHLVPSTLVEQAQALAERYPDITVRVMDRAAAAKDGWQAFLAVARGSQLEPYVIHAVYTPREKSPETASGLGPKRVVLVGKGITFDSGGLSLKPANSMVDMKIDMAGAATVLGVMSTVAALKLPVEVHALVATCENMPSGTAYRPGDVLHSRSGKTIEIGNTDAEGRVTLADALDYAQELKADAVIDLATLTGACMVALGETYAGLFSNDQELSDALMAAARRAGEGLEDLPLPEEYKMHVESKVADVTNAPANNPMGGAITAALFLQEFAGKQPWAHLDVAGPVHMSRAILPYWSHGATGYGVRTLVEFLKGMTNDQKMTKF